MIKVSIELKDEEYANLWHAIQDLEQDNKLTDYSFRILGKITNK
jgi:hypothetical protein|tara:strand:+ start:1469 stop:1600 length:132 start_codon:yes stop_codon:yes gene_type:complete